MDEQIKNEQDTKGKTFTQADVDAAVESRLQRERAKYADYAELKEKADKYDKAEDAAKSELQKAQEQAADFKAKLDAREKELEAVRSRDKVSAETGVPAALLTGETEDACRTQAAALLQWRGASKPAPNRSVDHLLGTKPAKGGLEAGFAKLSDDLFPQN